MKGENMKVGDLVKHKETGEIGLVTYKEETQVLPEGMMWIFVNVYYPDGSTHCWEINDCEVLNENR
jgi:hypothetical protein